MDTLKMTMEDFNASVEKAVDAKLKAKETEIAAEKKANLRQEMQEAFEAAEQHREAKGYKAEAPEIKFAKIVNLFANADGNVENMARLAGKMYGDDMELKGYMAKALEAGVPTSGGFGIPNVLSSRVIDILYAKTILDKIGVAKIPMVNGNVRMTRMDTAASVGWVGELPATTPTAPVFGDVSLTAKKMFAFAEISNSLVRYNSVGIEGWLARELQRRARILLDYTAFYGAGTVNAPAGLDKLGVQTLGTSSTALVQTHPDNMIALLKQANVPMDLVAWAMSPQMESWLKMLKTTTGAWIFRDEMVKESKLAGFPYYVSTSISYTDTTTDYGDLWLGDFSEFLWGTGLDLSLEMSREGTFVSGGTTYSAFQRDSQLVRVVAEHDFNVMHAASFVKGTFSVA
jgi:HK97 family phage major capsid protein